MDIIAIIMIHITIKEALGITMTMIMEIGYMPMMYQKILKITMMVVSMMVILTIQILKTARIMIQMMIVMTGIVTLLGILRMIHGILEARILVVTGKIRRTFCSSFYFVKIEV